MEYHVQYATEADAPALAQINVKSFQSRGLLDQLFPEANQSALQDYKSIYTMEHLVNPQMHVLKIADPASGEIVGYGRWLIPESLGFGTSVPDLSEQAMAAAQDTRVFAPRPMNEALYAAFRSLLEQARKRHTTEQDMMLDLLATLPAYQGRGIGTAMLKWGTTKADAWGSRIYLEATDVGYPVYINHGFRPVEEVILDRAQFGGEGSESFVIMIRDPRSVQ